MSTLVELIKRIGIFMIAAQAVIHFTPGQKYEKYIKLIVGMMVLLQFVVPLRSIPGGMEIDWNVQMADMERLLETEGITDEIAGSSSVAESVMDSLEKEIKSKLNDEISGENYVISNVQVYMKVSDGDGESYAGTRQYELEKVRVAVYRRSVWTDGQTDVSAGNPIEKIQIDKIYVGGAADSGGPVPESADGSGSPYMEGAEETAGTEAIAEQLRERFCGVLGMEVEKMEVSIYGTNEKTD